jgi:hypothetical protein
MENLFSFLSVINLSAGSTHRRFGGWLPEPESLVPPLSCFQLKTWFFSLSKCKCREIYSTKTLFCPYWGLRDWSRIFRKSKKIIFLCDTWNVKIRQTFSQCRQTALEASGHILRQITLWHSAKNWAFDFTVWRRKSW